MMRFSMHPSPTSVALQGRATLCAPGRCAQVVKRASSQLALSARPATIAAAAAAAAAMLMERSVIDIAPHRPLLALRRRGNASSTKGLGRRLKTALGVFTGIVQGTAEVTDVESTDKFAQIKIKFPPNKVDNVKLGASVAVNGTCLTVTEAHRDTLAFDIMAETLRTTNLGELGAGSVVNFERAAKLGDEIGGHNVSGHVHTTATISNVEQLPNSRRVTMTLSDPRWIKYILPKGFVAVDGTSLTVGEVNGSGFSVYLIPETLRATVFGIKSVGDTVNIEVEAQTQAIVDTVERVIAQYMERLGVSQQVQHALSGAGDAAHAHAVNGNGGGAAAAAQQQQLAALASALAAQRQQEQEAQQQKQQLQLQQKQKELDRQRLEVQRQLEKLQREQQALQQEMQAAAAAAAAARQRQQQQRESSMSPSPEPMPAPAEATAAAVQPQVVVAEARLSHEVVNGSGNDATEALLQAYQSQPQEVLVAQSQEQHVPVAAN